MIAPGVNYYFDPTQKVIRARIKAEEDERWEKNDKEFRKGHEAFMRRLKQEKEGVRRAREMLSRKPDAKPKEPSWDDYLKAYSQGIPAELAIWSSLDKKFKPKRESFLASALRHNPRLALQSYR